MSKFWFLRYGCKYSEHTINPLLSPLGAYLFRVSFKSGGGGGGGGSLFNLAKMMVSILH